MPKLYDSSKQEVFCKCFNVTGGGNANCFVNNAGDPNTPAAGEIAIYGKLKSIYIKDDAALVTDLGAGGGGGGAQWADAVDPFICPCNACNVCALCIIGTTCIASGGICLFGAQCISSGVNALCINTGGNGTVLITTLKGVASATCCSSVQCNGKMCVCGGAASPGFYCNNALKAATIQLKDSRIIKLYTVESPDVVFKDYGSGYICNKLGRIELDKYFLEVTSNSLYNIQITPTADLGFYYISKKEESSFEVIAERDGTFDWEITKIRKNMDTIRWDTINLNTNESQSIYNRENTFEKY